MLKAYTPATYRTVTEYELVFDDGRNNGFGFPCDRDGKLLESEDKNRELHENLKFCLAHPEKFDRFNEVVEYRRRIREDARGDLLMRRRSGAVGPILRDLPVPELRTMVQLVRAGASSAGLLGRRPVRRRILRGVVILYVSPEDLQEVSWQ